MDVVGTVQKLAVARCTQNRNINIDDIANMYIHIYLISKVTVDNDFIRKDNIDYIDVQLVFHVLITYPLESAGTHLSLIHI